MAQENKDLNCNGKFSAELRNITAEQLWPLLEDFCNFHKWIPALNSEKCHQIEGSYGEPGLLKYCQFTEQSSSSLFSDTETKWCNEKLLSMDPVHRTLSYAVTDNNIGFNSYVANMKLVEIDGGCKIEWWFTCDPIEGISSEDLKAFMESTFKTVVNEMENYLSSKDAKWEGKSSAEMIGITAEELWPFFEDFCNIHKWVPSLDSDKCRHEGTYGEIGLIRCIVFTEQSAAALCNETDKDIIKWCNEKLVLMDPVKRNLSYEITENNLGFKSYVCNVKLIEIDGGCKIEGSFVCDPVEGMKLEDLRGFLESNLKFVAEGMRKEIETQVK